MIAKYCPRFLSRRMGAFGPIGIAAALALSACEGAQQEAPPAPPPPEVTVAKPVVREVVAWDEYTGRLAAINSVEIRARVSGYLESANFRDGQIVEKGDLLFVIDPRPYEAALNVAEAEVVQAQTRLELAQNDLGRAEQLLETKAISTEEFDTRCKAVSEAEAALEAARARVESARLDVEFTEIRSPITGRISERQVDVGNLISGGSAGATLLTNIVSLDPIHCEFDVSERAYLKYQRLSKEGIRASSRDVANPVFVGTADEDGFPHQGRMDFVDNQIDRETGTMRGRAVIDNPDLALTPGMFVRLRLLGSGRFEAIQLPDEAIGTDQTERFVYVVGPDNVVEMRLVAVGELIDGLRVISDGLAGDERVIVNGLQRARAGEPVAPTETELEAPPADISMDGIGPAPRLDESPGEGAPLEAAAVQTTSEPSA